MGNTVDHFDPTDQEIGPELVNELETHESMYTPDTNGDPEVQKHRRQAGRSPH